MGGRDKREIAEGAKHGQGAHAEVTLGKEDIVVTEAAPAEFLIDSLQDFGGRHQEIGRETLGEFFPGSEGLKIVMGENIVGIQDRGVVPVLEIMAILVGGRENLAADGLRGIDQGEGSRLGFDIDKGTGEPGLRGHPKTDDAAAVSLEESEYVADGLVAEIEAAALLGGQALGSDIGSV